MSGKYFIIIGIAIIIVGIAVNFAWSKLATSAIVESHLAMGQVNGSNEDYVIGHAASKGYIQQIFNWLFFWSGILMIGNGLIKTRPRG